MAKPQFSRFNIIKEACSAGGCPRRNWHFFGNSHMLLRSASAQNTPDAPGCPRMPLDAPSFLARMPPGCLQMSPVFWPGCPLTCWPESSSAGTLLSASCVIFKNPRSHGDEVFVSDVGISPNYSGCFRMPWVFNPGCPPAPGQKRREPMGMRGGVKKGEGKD